ncbi:SAM50-like protein SPAC17C9.06 [Lolium rigidum]|uniref:SAM50-like protein SPAC17C9.06 n=1 Tax=Lolium rigidum TaxID=89674 RepID=UPI001F5D94A1|nr:SAM50-like protein SPAC17C9.06 [Lolium rigidum]
MPIAADSTAEQAPDPAPHEPSEKPRKVSDQPDRGEDNEVDFEEEEDAEELDGPAAVLAAHKERARAVFARFYTEPIGIRVHDIIIKGNLKTRASLIEAEVADLLRSAGTVQHLLHASRRASTLLRDLDVFDSVTITLDAGPPEFPGTTNVVIQVVEAARRFDGGIYSKAKARSWSVLGWLMLKNLFGYGDIWDASAAYIGDRSFDIGIGAYLPRFKSIPIPLMARASVISTDWLKFSSYKERLLGLSFDLFSSWCHNVSYNLGWRTLTDPSQMASESIRRQLGRDLLSALSYTYKIDKRDSELRPTEGCAFISTSQVGGLWKKGLRFFRQEFDVRGAVPFGFCNAALNVGIAAGVILPLGRGFMELSSPVPDRFYLGGHSSPVSSLGALSSLLGFQRRGVGPSEPRRSASVESVTDHAVASSGRDYLGGDLAVSAFADLSFDLPGKFLRDTGIHGHAFLSAGNLAKLSESEYKNFSFPEFRRTFRSSAGVGIVWPTKLFRLEMNYCYILKKLEHDCGKSGIQFSICSPS